MLLCWKDDADNRPSFEAVVEMLQNVLIDSGSPCQSYRSIGGGDSYVVISDFSSSGNNYSDDQTVFYNSSLSYGASYKRTSSQNEANNYCHAVYTA